MNPVTWMAVEVFEVSLHYTAVFKKKALCFPRCSDVSGNLIPST